MSIFGGLQRSLLGTISQVALGAITGGASMLAQMATQLIAQAARQAISQLGQMLGLSQGQINTALRAFDRAAGVQSPAQDLRQLATAMGQQLRGSPVETAQAVEDLNRTVNNLVSRLSESEDFKNARANAGRTGGASSNGWLMALAEALGKKLDKMAGEIQSLAGQISDKNPSMTAKFGAKTQEFGILFNATNNAIKTIGENITTTARKG
jgi:hypothetical protein